MGKKEIKDTVNGIDLGAVDTTATGNQDEVKNAPQEPKATAKDKTDVVTIDKYNAIVEVIKDLACGRPPRLNLL